MEDYLTCLATPRQAARKNELDKLYQETRRSDTSAFFACLEQSTSFQKPSHLFHPLVTHNKIWSWTKERLVTPGECFAASGLDWYESLAGDRSLTPLKQVFQDLSIGQLQKLVGNSLHIPSIGTFMLYCFCHLERRSDHERLAPSLPENPSEEEEEEEPDYI